MNNFLKDKLQGHLSEIKAYVESFPWEDKTAYTNWLAQTYFFVRHSTHLIALASGNVPLGNKFHRGFAEHLGTELGHEKLLLNDLKALGCDISQFKEFACTAAIYQSQYYYIEHQTAIAFFGYAMALENSATEFGQNTCDRVKKAYPNQRCTSFLQVHATEDIEHVQHGYEQMKDIPPEAVPYVIENMEQTFSRYKALLKECQALSASYKKVS